jgi:hypothetical protein
VTHTANAVTNTNPFGWCFVSYRRARQLEIADLVRALHELGIPTWQDLHNLDEQPLEAALRAVLQDPNTASGVLWVTPEVRGSPVITNVEVPGLTDRADDDPVFTLVPVAAGGLDYEGAAAAARGATALVDLSTWNISKAEGDPATANDITRIAQRVLRRRVRAVHRHLAPGEPFVIDVYTRAPATHHLDAALTIDFTHLFRGRLAKPRMWDTVTTCLRTTLTQVAVDAPGRALHLRGLIGLPTAVALGVAAPAPSGFNAAWVQRTPGRSDSLYTLNARPAPSSFVVDLMDGSVAAADLAVLVSLTENTVPAFQATTGLGPFRGIVHASAPDGHPHLLDSPEHGVDLAQAVVRTMRSARSRYGHIGTVHLFIAGPAGLAFLIGQSLNTFGEVIAYEHLNGSGTGTYVPALSLTPSS